jgi:hypothetical protein
METVIRLAVLAAAFAASTWAGYAATRPATPRASSGDGAAPAPANLGDLDGGRAAQPASAPPKDAGGGAGAVAGGAAAGQPRYARITFADISQWDLDPESVQFPESIRALHGKDVDLVGYMLPYGNPDAVEEFVLVKDLGSCCFGAAPQPHHVVECRFEPGKKTAYVPGPVRIRGRFRIEEHRQGKFLISVFAMTVSDCVEVR